MTNANAGTSGTKDIATRYPVTTGIIAGTTKQEGRTSNLVAQGLNGVKSIVPERERVGL